MDDVGREKHTPGSPSTVRIEPSGGGPLRRGRRSDAPRYDRTLRVIMWCDAFLSVVLVAVGLVASPLVAVLGVPPAILFSVAVASIVCAVLLAAFGAITAVVIMLRMHRGDHQLPVRLWLPLPPGMQPSMYAQPRRRSD